MKLLKLAKLIAATASLASISQPVHAEWIGKASEKIDHLGRELSVPPKIGLVEGTQPVTHDLVGKALYFKFPAFSPDKPSVVIVRFDSDKWVTVWDPNAPENSYKYSYVVFNIAKNIYYLNWAENTAPDMPFEGAWLAAIVLDLNKMVGTDTYTSPTEDGKVRYYIEQFTVVVEDIAKAKGDKRYFPKGFAADK